MITIIIAIHKIEPGPPVFRATAVPEIFPTPKFPPKIVNRAAIEENLFSPFLAPRSERAYGNLNTCSHFSLIDR